jgi:hypothetical protein
MTDKTPRLADNLLVGVAAFSIEVFGDDSPRNVRRMRQWLDRGIVPCRKVQRTFIGHKDEIAQKLRGEAVER